MKQDFTIFSTKALLYPLSSGEHSTQPAHKAHKVAASSLQAFSVKPTFSLPPRVGYLKVPIVASQDGAQQQTEQRSSAEKIPAHPALTLNSSTHRITPYNEGVCGTLPETLTLFTAVLPKWLWDTYTKHSWSSSRQVTRVSSWLH